MNLISWNLEIARKCSVKIANNLIVIHLCHINRSSSSRIVYLITVIQWEANTLNQIKLTMPPHKMMTGIMISIIIPLSSHRMRKVTLSISNTLGMQVLWGSTMPLWVRNMIICYHKAATEEVWHKSMNNFNKIKLMLITGSSLTHLWWAFMKGRLRVLDLRKMQRSNSTMTYLSLRDCSNSNLNCKCISTNLLFTILW